MRAFIPALLIGAVFAASSPAQIGIGRLKTSNLPGDFFLPPGSINLTETLLASSPNDGSGFIDFHGVVKLPNGHYLVSQGREDFSFLPLLFELDANGTWLATINQPDEPSLSGKIGHTNLAWDMDLGPDSRVWGVKARAMRSYDWRARTFDAINVQTNLFLGLKALDLFEGFEARAATIAEVGGQKILVCADKKDQVMPFVSHAVTNYYPVGLPFTKIPPFKPTTPNISPLLGASDTGKLGAAFDPIHGTVWWQIDAGDNNPNPNKSATRFFEMDLDGNLTGQVIQGDRGIGGTALGCDMHIDANGDLVLAYMVNMGTGGDNPLFIPLQEDLLIEMYASFGFGTSCGGTIGFETEPYVGNLDWRVTLENAPANPLGRAFLLRGSAIPSPGLIIPGFNSCGLLINLGGAANPCACLLVGGAASFNQKIPNLPALIDLDGAFQWLLPDGPVGGLPLDLSDAGVMRIGSNL